MRWMIRKRPESDVIPEQDKDQKAGLQDEQSDPV